MFHISTEQIPKAQMSVVELNFLSTATLGGAHAEKKKKK